MIDVPQELKEYMTTHGRQYVPALLPKEIRRGKVKTCFDTCVKNAIDNNETFRYVEGIALHPNKQIWILHAWLTDGVHAYDPTWQAFDHEQNEVVLPVTYVGIELPLKPVGQFMLKTKYCGVIANSYMLPEFVNSFMPAPLPIEALKKTYQGQSST